MKIRFKSQSQVGQENFVLFLSKFRKSGNYLEVGASDGTTINNTLVLEGLYGWQGVGVELDENLARQYRHVRVNDCICADATSLDYQAVLDERNFPNQIDYLQIDIDPAYQSLIALEKVLQTSRRFNIITFEHDLYVSHENSIIKLSAYQLLTQHGYKRVRSNVKYDGAAFEDWYVDTRQVSLARVLLFPFLQSLGLINLRVMLASKFIAFKFRSL